MCVCVFVCVCGVGVLLRFWAVKTETSTRESDVRVYVLSSSDGSTVFTPSSFPAKTLRVPSVSVAMYTDNLVSTSLESWAAQEAVVVDAEWTSEVSATETFGPHAVSTEFDSTVSGIEMYRATVSVDMGSSSASRFRVSFPSGFFMSSTESAYVDVDTQGGTLVTVVRQGSADAEATAEYRASNPSVVDVT